MSQTTSKKRSHNHNNNQTNPKKQPNTKNKPTTNPIKKVRTKKNPQQQLKENVISNHIKLIRLLKA
jgi:hypothetical protein